MIFPEVETDASGERQSAKDVPEAADHDCRAVWRRPSSIVSHGREHAPRRKKLAQGSHPQAVGRKYQWRDVACHKTSGWRAHGFQRTRHRVGNAAWGECNLGRLKILSHNLLKRGAAESLGRSPMGGREAAPSPCGAAARPANQPSRLAPVRARLAARHKQSNDIPRAPLSGVLFNPARQARVRASTNHRPQGHGMARQGLRGLVRRYPRAWLSPRGLARHQHRPCRLLVMDQRLRRGRHSAGNRTSPYRSPC
jgi:hypothetical protein